MNRTGTGARVGHMRTGCGSTREAWESRHMQTLWTCVRTAPSLQTDGKQAYVAR